MALKRKTDRKKCKRCSPQALFNDDRLGLGAKNPEGLLKTRGCAPKISNMK
jgi:hypothetical protein